MTSTSSDSAGFWQNWLAHPQRLPLRRALLQIHLWSALCFGLYIFFISVTGSVLVYRNELLVFASGEPVYTQSTAALLDEQALRAAVLSAYPQAKITRLNFAEDQDQAVDVWLLDRGTNRRRLFDPRTGADLGRSVPLSYSLVRGLMEVHDNFLAGPAGRKVNGFAAFSVLLVALTGIIIWWPGRRRWKRSMMLRRGVGSKRLVWDIHSVLGIWSFVFICIFALSGIYLCFPGTFHDFAEWLQPSTSENAGNRLTDKVLYWLAFLHFGRINGIGIPCDGPGLCDQSVKAVWALFGLAPAVMFVTGTIMWWNRVLRRWLKSVRRKPEEFPAVR